MSQLCLICILVSAQLLEDAANFIQTAAFFRVKNRVPCGPIARLSCT